MLKMTGLLLLLSWIAGIASMGMPWVGWLKPMLFSMLFFMLSVCVILSLLPQLSFHVMHSPCWRYIRLSAWLLSSALLGAVYADQALTTRLALRSLEPKSVSALIYVDAIAQNSQADPNRWQHKVTVLNQQPVPVYWRLSYPAQAPQTPQLGQYYRVTGQVKAAHSYAIAGVFDQERWWLQQNIMASLQVETMQLLSPEQIAALGYRDFVRQQQSVFARLAVQIEAQRLSFRDFIARHSFHNAGLLLALLTGDESLLGADTQQLFKALGISHLLAISGPHVLVFAMLFCWLFMRIVHWLCPLLLLRIARPYLLVLPFLLCVWLYAALVGFEIPAQRTLLSVVLISAFLLMKQALAPLKILLISASLLLLFDPFSVLSAAFWLSYGACFILLRVYQSLQTQRARSQSAPSRWQSLGAFLYLMTVSQWKIFIALAPLLLLMFHQISWLAPIANFIAVPMIGSLIVPIEVLAASISMYFPTLAVYGFHLADALLQALLLALQWLDRFAVQALQYFALSTWQIIALSLLVAMRLLPQGVLPRAWIGLGAMALLFSHRSRPEFELNILDVGQGQAIFLALPKHKMMIDVGGKYNEQQWGVGQQLIIPYLMDQGIARLDQVVLSHLDQDHSGAFDYIQQVVPIAKLYSSENDARFQGLDFNYCYAGQQWRYGQISITVLSPQRDQLQQAHQDKNEHSCVIYIQVPQAQSLQNFLIMGDAGWKTEYQLLQQYPDLKVDVLVLGHHGSRHSSSYAFLKQLQPKWAVVSAGKDNRYGHPNPIVLARLKDLSIPVLSTIEHGSVQFYLDQQQMKWSVYRDQRRWLKRES